MKKLRNFLTTTEGKFLTFIVACIVLSFGYYFYAMKDGQGGAVKQVTIDEQDHVRGAIGGRVTLVEFGDLQCPACAAYEPILRQLLANNSDTLQFVFKHFPLTQIHPNAFLAAKATEAAAIQGKFWEMHDILYDRQSEWGGSLNARDVIAGYAGMLGLDVEQFNTDLNNTSIEEKIAAEYKEGTSLGVQGTPTFFVNGVMIESPSSFEAFDALIKAAAQVQAN